jgi:phage terminase small subunit
MARKSAAELATPKPLFTAKRPPPPADLPAGAAALWVSICASVDANYFTTGDMVLLEALCRADSQKRACDALVSRDGVMLPDGTPNPALKMSVTLSASMAALSGKLRLCKSATTRAESAGLKKALHSGPRPWDTDPALEHFFND